MAVSSMKSTWKPLVGVMWVFDSWVRAIALVTAIGAFGERYFFFGIPAATLFVWAAYWFTAAHRSLASAEALEIAVFVGFWGHKVS